MRLVKKFIYDYKCFHNKNTKKFLSRNINSFSTKNEQFKYENEKLHNFGFQKVTEEIKSKLVNNLFSNVSNKYDIMNDLMSFLLHRCWKNEFVKELDPFLKYYSYNIQELCKKKNTFLNEEILTYETITETRTEKTEGGNIERENTNQEDNKTYQNGSKLNEHDNETVNNKKSKQTNSFCKCKILDLAGGTGDIAFRILDKSKHFLKKNNETFFDDFYQKYMPNLIVCDANRDMIDVGIQKAKELNYNNNITWLIENAENLKSIESNSIDIITLSFGIRNFTNISIALKEIHRVLKPGGRFLCLEFTKLNCDVINLFYKFYLNNFIPLLGKLVANDMDSYKYLSESIQTFLTPYELSQLIYQSNLRNISHTTMTFGVVAIHSAYKMD